MKLRILGCGTSTGVPRIGGGWGDCDPQEPRNRRLRSSILIESAGKYLLVDCGPDLRQQMLAADCDRIEALIVTHDHADHCHGIDDLRPFAQQLGRPVPLYSRAVTLERLQTRFAYAFAGSTFYSAIAEPVEVGQELAFGSAQLRFVDQPHGNITSLGMRIEEDGKSAAYSIDFNELNDQMKSLYHRVDIWVCDCLSRQPHPTHAHLDAVVGWARELNVGRLYLSHLGNDMDYRTLVAELPDWAAPAHDGLEIDL